MDPQKRFNSFLAYLEDCAILASDQKQRIEIRIGAFQPYQSEYLPMVFPGGLHWFYAEDRIICARIIKSLFHNGNLKASLNKTSKGWKTIRIEKPDYFILDLLYSYKNNINNLSGLTIINIIANKKDDSFYIINSLQDIINKLRLLTRNDSDIIKAIDSLEKTMVNIYDKCGFLTKDLIRAIKKEYKHHSIIRHLAMVFKHYVSEIGSEILCKRIQELLINLYPDKNYNIEMVKKDLQRHKLL